MHPIYPNLFSPLRVGNVILRNRMVCPPSDPHYIQAGENFPSEATIRHYASRARNGAALVTVEGNQLHTFPEEDHHWGWDVTKGSTQNAVSQLADAVHFYGSICTGTIMCFAPPGWDVSERLRPLEVTGDLADRPEFPPAKELTEEMLLEIIEQQARLARLDKECGLDGVYIHMSYRMVLTGRMLSPLTNHRTDKFGGSFENRIRFPLMLCRRIKELCGPDFLIEASITGDEGVSGGWTVEDTIRFAHEARGLIDMLQVRCGDVDPNHPTGFCLQKTPFLDLTAAVKKGAPEMIVTAVAGYFDPEENERVLAEGKADLIAMARAFISNPDYGKLVFEGRRDELVPCIRCNKCHRSAPHDPWHSVCSVNPRWPLEDRTDRLIVPPEGGRRIAVIGGGIAGMQAAEVCAGRGDQVTLFEKSDRLGGALLHAEYADFKWPIRDFLHYHIHRVTDSDAIDVRLNTEPEPEALAAEGYDAVLVAVGAKPVVPAISGADGPNVWQAVEVYGREKELPEELVIVGGGEVGAETGLYLARAGHRVTILARRDRLAPEAYRVHYYSMFLEACEKEPNLSWLLEADCTSIGDGFVTWRSRDGKEHRLEAAGVILAAGTRPDLDAAMRYAQAGKRFYAIGDCAGGGNIQHAVRTAYDTANSF
ncbi:MAG: FAD-dependent oxidoreductase [Oscillospiraceae bacterium]|nr:FAD-dependent oxidoreductase [Oscillospiraceae bacterium]